MKYERLELEAFQPKQNLCMLQNAVGDVTELAYVNQIGDQDIARGTPPLTYVNYMELLLSACSTYHKRISLPGSRNVQFIRRRHQKKTLIGITVMVETTAMQCTTSIPISQTLW
jgi:hypothetical protein